jgi:putative addiction module component (TIGR02574 family)
VSRESEDDPDVEEAWRAEIERRVAELDSGAVETVPWEIVKARLLQRIRNLRSLGQE